MELDRRIYELLESLGGKHTLEGGIVTVTFPNGEVWDFTEPTDVTENKKE